MARLKFGIISTIALLVTALVVFPLGTSQGAAKKPRIAVFISYRSPPFDEVSEGFQKYLSKQGLSADYDLCPLEGDSAKAGQTVQRIKSNKPDLIFALGSLAVESTIKEVGDTPVIAGMILRPDLLKKAPNGTGVFLEFPAEMHLKWLQRFLPNSKTIGVIYNPKENREKIESAGILAQKLGMTLQARSVDTPQGLPTALNGLVRQVDVLWGVPDSLVLNTQTAKQVLLFSFRNLIPFAGLSSTWVKAGALYSLVSDYTDNGAQCGEIAFKLLQGAKASSIPPGPPRKVVYSLNLNTAKHMKINIPEELLRGAHQRF